MAPRVMTVSGPIPPEKLGFTLPHEHTAISLWHIANRWDYWELTPDDDLMIEELRDFRRRGGSTLVDLTPPGVGRDPDRLRRLAIDDDARLGVQRHRLGERFMNRALVEHLHRVPSRRGRINRCRFLRRHNRRRGGRLGADRFHRANGREK